MKKRAMTEHAKTEKARMILNTARNMYREKNYEEIKMSDIAKAAKISNGTLFNYYKTKEILFMEILFLEYERRFQHFLKVLTPIRKMTDKQFKEFFLEEMAGILEPDSVFIRLSAIKNTILEKNIDEETAQKATQAMSDVLEPVLQLLKERVNFFSVEAFFHLLGAQNAIIVGYMNIASMPDVMHHAITGKRVKGFEVKFKEDALTAMEYYLDGWIKSLEGT
jgi:AcrR family transcriptional regulator